MRWFAQLIIVETASRYHGKPQRMPFKFLISLCRRIRSARPWNSFLKQRNWLKREMFRNFESTSFSDCGNQRSKRARSTPLRLEGLEMRYLMAAAPVAIDDSVYYTAMNTNLVVTATSPTPPVCGTAPGGSTKLSKLRPD